MEFLRLDRRTDKTVRHYRMTSNLNFVLWYIASPGKGFKPDEKQA
ncbi:hypothetical protein ACNKHX_19325 [Shigella flexneri]